jgi:hypothetical protein
MENLSYKLTTYTILGLEPGRKKIDKFHFHVQSHCAQQGKATKSPLEQRLEMFIQGILFFLT